MTESQRETEREGESDRETEDNDVILKKDRVGRRGRERGRGEADSERETEREGESDRLERQREKERMNPYGQGI